jgi:hypothetical protein
MARDKYDLLLLHGKIQGLIDFQPKKTQGVARAGFYRRILDNEKTLQNQSSNNSAASSYSSSAAYPSVPYGSLWGYST